MGSIQQDNITFINIDAPTIGAPKYRKQTLIKLKEETENNTIIVRKFNSLLSSMDRLSRQKINKKTWDLNDTIGQIA